MTFSIPPNISEFWLELPDGSIHWLKNRCSIGRTDDNDLVLSAVGISRHHALMMPTSAGYTVTDLQSSNGTHVNDRLINRPTGLRDCDGIRLADIVLRFRCTRKAQGPDDDSRARTTQIMDDVRTKLCLLMVADVEGYCAMNDRIGGEAALKNLQGWITGMRSMISMNGGNINSYAGDAILAYWFQEMTSGEKILSLIREFEAYRATATCPFRIVLHCGPIMFTKGDVGEELKGQDVNFVFRAEKIAKRLRSRAMLSEEAVKVLGVMEHCVPIGVSAVDGINGSFTFYSVR